MRRKGSTESAGTQIEYVYVKSRYTLCKHDLFIFV